MITRGRLAAFAALLLLAAGLWTAWLGFQAYDGLRQAESAAGDLRTSIDAGDQEVQQVAVSDLAEGAAQVRDSTDGWWWGALTHLPWVGDDFEAVQVLGSSLDLVAGDGAEPLLAVSGELDGVTAGGRLDLDVVRALQGPMRAAATSFHDAADQAGAVDPNGLSGVLQRRFLDYQAQLTTVADGLAAGSTAVDLLPAMAGGEGERDYLLIFQNNAEIRATGGLPGSWARLSARDGRLELREQGVWGDFPVLDGPVVPLTPAEQASMPSGYGLTFQSPGYSRDFPRAARMWDAFWSAKYPATDLDGVLALDPVALSYLLDGTGPVQVGDTTLTSENLVQKVLSDPYLTIEDPAAQDVFFQATARAIFQKLTGDLASPTDLVGGLARAGREGRLLVAPFEDAEAAALDGTTVAGQLPSEQDAFPTTGIGINDATASKMSYYLRYDATTTATACRAGVQELAGSLVLRQDIAPADARSLPRYLTGGGSAGTEPGSQLLSVQVYGPAGGDFGAVQLDGEVVQGLTSSRLDNGQPVVRLAVLLDSRDDVRVTWSASSGQGQVGDPRLEVTPGVVPGDQGSTSASACD